jgi:hypothetical protein
MSSLLVMGVPPRRPTPILSLGKHTLHTHICVVQNASHAQTNFANPTVSQLFK